MRVSNCFLFISLILFLPALAQAQPVNDQCEYFYKELMDLPHEQLEYQKGVITFSWDKKEYSGCEIKFVTNDSLMAGNHRIPSFWPKNTPYLYQKGWRYNLNYDADGPGSSVFGIEKDDMLCLIYRAQPAYLNDKGEIVHGAKITVTVECVVKEKD